MKPELAVLPLEVWADVFISPYQWISRQKLAHFADNIKNRKFTEKLQKLLHGCGKHSLRYLQISSKPKAISDGQPIMNPFKYQLRKRKLEPERQASLAIAPCGTRSYGLCWMARPNYKHCEFPESEMPENINNFKQLTIGHLDDEVLAFLHKIKPLFTNVNLSLVAIESPRDVRILFAHLFPMLGGIREIACKNDCLELLGRHFPGPLAMAKELDVVNAKPASIPAYLNWLCAPQDFDLNGPRFLKTSANWKTIFGIVNAVRQHFLAATISSTFVIFLEFHRDEQHYHAEEYNIDNTATNEHLAVRNTHFKMPKYYFSENINYVEILRHPTGEEARMREWLNVRAYYEKIYKEQDCNEDGDANYSDGSDDDDDTDEPNEEYLSEEDEEESNEEVGSDEDENEEDFTDSDDDEEKPKVEAEQVISIVWPTTFVHVTKSPGVATNQAVDEPADDDDGDDAGPSTSAKKMKK